MFDSAVPEEIIQVIGAAPKAGRRRWLALAELLSDAKAKKAAIAVARAPDLATLDSDGRFLRVLAAAAPAPSAKATQTAWKGEGGQTMARISRSGSTVTLAIERDPAFGEFVASQLDELYTAFRQRPRVAADVEPPKQGDAIETS